jgi:hypothetical protein
MGCDKRLNMLYLVQHSSMENSMRRALHLVLSIGMASAAMAQTTPATSPTFVPGTKKIQVGLNGRGDYSRPDKVKIDSASANAGTGNGAPNGMINDADRMVAKPAAIPLTPLTPTAAKSSAPAPLRSDSKLASDSDKARALQAEKDKLAAEQQKAAAAAAATASKPTGSSTNNSGLSVVGGKIVQPTSNAMPVLPGTAGSY